MSHSWDLSCDNSSSGKDAFSSFWCSAERWESGMEILKGLTLGSRSDTCRSGRTFLVVGDVSILGDLGLSF